MTVLPSDHANVSDRCAFGHRRYGAGVKHTAAMGARASKITLPMWRDVPDVGFTTASSAYIGVASSGQA